MNNLKKAFKSFAHLIASGFTFGVRGEDEKLASDEEKAIKENDVLKEEAIKSPGKVAVRNYFRNPLGVIGLVLFVGIILTTVIGSKLIPFNPYYSEGTLINIGPGSGYMKYPKELVKEGVDEVSVGNTFAVGLSKKGKVYYRGKDNEDKVLKMPKDIEKKLKGKKITHVAAGDKHIIVSTEDNEVYGRGNDSFQQDKMPPMQEEQIKEEGIKKLGAGVQYSVVLTEKNNLIVRGSTMNTRLDLIPSDVQGKVEDFDAASINLIAILKDGSLSMLGVRGAENDTAMPEELKNGSVKVKSVALTTKSAAAVDENGKLYARGPTSERVGGNYLPKLKGKAVKVVGGASHFDVLDDKGNVYSWGKKNYNSTKAPEDGKYSDIFAGYFNNYAVRKDKKGIDTWGLDGFKYGSDDQGRDLRTRLIHGGKTTIRISFISIIISMLLGVVIGMVSGYAGGSVDNILMRITEIVSSFPFYPLLITLSATLPPEATQNQRIMMVMILQGILGRTGIARLVRGQIIAEREKDYITAARALGVTNGSIMRKHIFPNILSIIIVEATIGYAENILSEAGLSFLGFGVQEPMPSWGNMLTAAQSSEVITTYRRRWIIPAVAVFLTSFSVNLIGDALRDAIDPRSNEK